MSIEKSFSLVLATAPYRESSMLVYLFSRRFGRVHGLAKGIRKGNKRGIPLERGCFIEHTIYFKQHSNLHLITDCHIKKYFPAIRGNLEKTAIRDVVFDLLLSAIKDTDAHLELFEYLELFIAFLEVSTLHEKELLAQLSKVLFEVAGHLGFELDFNQCAACEKQFPASDAVILSVETGMLHCTQCVTPDSKNHHVLPADVVRFFSSPTGSDQPLFPQLSNSGVMAMMRMSWNFCRYHLDLRKKLDALTFLEELFALPALR